ncbi:MAG: SMP-30/gluconolactonase/LRE family protein [Porticoccaceae bacterium]
MTNEQTPTLLLKGLTCPDGARWRDGHLWLSDFFSGRVLKIAPDGSAETVAEVPGRPSGLGWLPDGSLQVVSMTDLRLLRFRGSDAPTAVDLSALATFHTNDMVMDARGRAYIGNCGFDYTAGEAPAPTVLILVTPHGQVRAVADDLMFPNGMVISADGKTLIVAETYGSRLTAFDIEADGGLANRRTWAQFDNVFPDGLCLDAEGAVWVASPTGQEVLRVHQGGEISQRIGIDQQPTCCALGGDDGRTLFILSTLLTASPEQLLADPIGRVDTVRVAVAGAR